MHSSIQTGVFSKNNGFDYNYHHNYHPGPHSNHYTQSLLSQYHTPNAIHGSMVGINRKISTSTIDLDKEIRSNSKGNIKMSLYGSHGHLNEQSHKSNIQKHDKGNHYPSGEISLLNDVSDIEKNNNNNNNNNSSNHNTDSHSMVLLSAQNHAEASTNTSSIKNNRYQNQNTT
jgi:hypothetical protein